MTRADPLRRRVASSGESVPNLAPMVDVIMVILVFFMLGASLTLTHEGLLPTELDPRSGPGGGALVEIVPTVQIAVRYIDAETVRISVMDTTLAGDRPLAALRGMLAGRLAAGVDPLAPVVIGADAAVPWEVIVQVMDSVLASGFANVQFTVSLTVAGDAS